MEEYSFKEDLPIGGYLPHEKNAIIPDPFKDLKVVKIRPYEGNIMVQGCFDHYVYLTFDGIGHSKFIKNKRQIILNWGEHPPNAGSQILWSEK